MKVLNLRCGNGHGFEGWFASEDDFLDQNGRAAIECPLCSDHLITRLPSAPRLNLSHPRPPPQAAAAQAADPQAQWLQAVRHLMANTVDVGEAFTEEARRIHYGEAPSRGIRGQATPEQREALSAEGIETLAVAVPAALKGPLQ